MSTKCDLIYRTGLTDVVKFTTVKLQKEDASSALRLAHTALNRGENGNETIYNVRFLAHTIRVASELSDKVAHGFDDSMRDNSKFQGHC